MAGALRGVHFAEIPPGQAKYIVCVHGAILDVVLDVRVGSPTYGQWDSILLDDQNKRAVYIAEGLGHGFMALTEGATVVYLCSAPYAPGREHGIHPLDPALAIAWPETGPAGQPLTPLLSSKDTGCQRAGRGRRARCIAKFRGGNAVLRRAGPKLSQDRRRGVVKRFPPVADRL
jgi:dTDP-4-dehydrorhamnose 3,5-epimerase